MAKLKVAVLFGGVSSEHDISLLSAYSILTNIPREMYDVMCIGITKKGHWMYYPGEYENIKDGSWELNPDCCTALLSPDRIHKGVIVLGENEVFLRKIDVVFPVLHGANGEDGTVQGLCRLAGLPCVGCDMTSSAVCMDKTVTHKILAENDIATAPYEELDRALIKDLEETAREMAKRRKFPLYVKPACAGSSVGVSRVNSADELITGIRKAFAHGDKVLVEDAMIGKEVECAVLGAGLDVLASVPGQITSVDGFYDYDSKYVNNTSVLDIPANITDDETRKVREIALKAFRACGCRGMARVDFFVTDNGVILNEINTIPGFTSISMYPKLMENNGISYPALLDRLIQLAAEQNDKD